MKPGQTDLGSKSSTEFMHQFAVKNLGMSVAIRDNAGNEIPSDKIESVQLSVDYTAPADDAYGYKVQSGAIKHYDVNLTCDGEQRVWTADSSPYIWQYVGEYKVQGLTVTVKGGKSLTYAAGTSGVPTAYTIMTKGPDSSNISLEDVKQVAKEFGKSSNNITGTFLQSYDLSGTNLKVSLKPKDKGGHQYAVLDNVTATLKLTYKNGKTAPNGGYSWTDTSAYENITLPMAAGDGDGIYRAGATPLLAGTYSAAIEVKVGKNTTTMNLSDISAYSKAPTVKAVSASMPGVSGAYEMNTNSAARAYGDTERVKVENYVSPEGDVATVYIRVTEWPQEVADGKSQIMVRYELPEVELSLGDAGAFVSANLVVPNAASPSYSATYTFESGTSRLTKKIGWIEEKSETVSDPACDSKVEVKYHVSYNAGEQKISTVTLLDKQNVGYVATLAKPLTIREKNEVPPTLNYAKVEGYNSFDSVVSLSGEPMEVTLPTQAEFGTKPVEQPVYPTETGWGAPVNTSSVKYCYVVRGLVKTSTEGTCNVTTYYSYPFTYHMYNRIQRIYERTDTTKFYNVTNGLTGWSIGEKTYAPGATVTVDGVLTATPIIGQLDSVFLREESVTMVHTTTQDVAANPATNTEYGAKKKNQDEAATQYTLPSGYAWFNSSDPYDKSSVNTTERQVGEDYRKN